MPITWKNVGVTSNNDAANLMRNAAQSFNTGAESLKGIVKDRQQTVDDNYATIGTNNKNAYLDKIASFGTAQDLQAAQQSGELDQFVQSLGPNFDSSIRRDAVANRLDVLNTRDDAAVDRDHTLLSRELTPQIAAIKTALANEDPITARRIFEEHSDGLTKLGKAPELTQLLNDTEKTLTRNPVETRVNALIAEGKFDEARATAQSSQSALGNQYDETLANIQSSERTWRNNARTDANNALTDEERARKIGEDTKNRETQKATEQTVFDRTFGQVQRQKELLTSAQGVLNNFGIDPNNPAQGMLGLSPEEANQVEEAIAAIHGAGNFTTVQAEDSAAFLELNALGGDAVNAMQQVATGRQLLSMPPAEAVQAGELKKAELASKFGARDNPWVMGAGVNPKAEIDKMLQDMSSGESPYSEFINNDKIRAEVSEVLAEVSATGGVDISPDPAKPDIVNVPPGVLQSILMGRADPGFFTNGESFRSRLNKFISSPAVTEQRKKADEYTAAITGIDTTLRYTAEGEAARNGLNNIRSQLQAGREAREQVAEAARTEAAAKTIADAQKVSRGAASQGEAGRKQSEQEKYPALFKDGELVPYASLKTPEERREYQIQSAARHSAGKLVDTQKEYDSLAAQLNTPESVAAIQALKGVLGRDMTLDQKVLDTRVRKLRKLEETLAKQTQKAAG